jgi:hypothetical protein
MDASAAEVLEHASRREIRVQEKSQERKARQAQLAFPPAPAPTKDQR